MYRGAGVKPAESTVCSVKPLNLLWIMPAKETMSSPDFSSNTGQSAQLSPAQASFVYWLNGLAPVLTSIVTPLATYWTLRKKPDKTIIQKYNQQINEVVRQFVSGTVGLVGYFGGGETTKGLLNGAGKLFPESVKLDEATKQVLMIVGGTAISFLGYAFIRPKISTDLIWKLLKQEEQAAKRSPEVLSSCKPIRWLQQWVDQTLVPAGKPDLSKTARYSAGLLTAYLGGGALLIGLMKQVFQHSAQSGIPSVETSSPGNAIRVFPIGGQPVPSSFSAEQANLYFAHRLQTSPPQTKISSPMLWQGGYRI
jgi:hypothetical protein